jgi:hypothetical protein
VFHARGSRAYSKLKKLFWFMFFNTIFNNISVIQRCLLLQNFHILHGFSVEAYGYGFVPERLPFDMKVKASHFHHLCSNQWSRAVYFHKSVKMFSNVSKMKKISLVIYIFNKES